MRETGLVKAFYAATAIPRYCVIALSAADNKVELANAKTAPLLGVSAEPADVAVGQKVDVIFSGIAEVKAGALIAKGAEVSVDTQGRVVTATSTDERIGRALQAANAANDIISIEINKF